MGKLNSDQGNDAPVVMDQFTVKECTKDFVGFCKAYGLWGIYVYLISSISEPNSTRLTLAFLKSLKTSEVQWEFLQNKKLNWLNIHMPHKP